MIATYGFTVIIASLWISRMIIEQRFIFKRTIFDLPLALFLGSHILSTLFSIHPYTSLFGYYTRFHGGLLSTISYYILFYAFVSHINRTQLKLFFVTLLTAGLLASAYAIPEHFALSPSCLLITGQLNTDCWAENTNPRYRIFGTFGQPNWLAAYAITLLPLAIVLSAQAWAHKDKKRAGWYGLVSVALFITLLFTRSRSGVLGLGLGLGLLAGALVIMRLRKRVVQPVISRGAIIVAALAMIGLGLGTPYSPSFISLIQSQRSTTTPISIETPIETPTAGENAAIQPINRLEAGGTDSGEIRKIVWTGAWRIWQRYPLLGSGVETFAYSYYQDRPVEHNLVSEWDFLYNKAHNEFLNFLATTGLVGLASYLFLLGSFGWIVLQLSFKKQDASRVDEQVLAACLGAGIVALSVSNFFGFSTVMVSILLFLYLGIIAVLYGQTAATTTHRTNTSLGVGQWLGLGLVAGATILLSIRVYRVWSADNVFATGKAYLQTSDQILNGVKLIQAASEIMPNEALYHDELAGTYARLAVALNQQQESTQAAQLAQAAANESNQTLRLNNRHLNFYKTRARIFLTLTELDPVFWAKAEETLIKAIQLAPTDAKLLYNLGLVYAYQGRDALAIETLAKSVELKSNYEAARLDLGKLYEQQGLFELGTAQYQYIYDYITQENEFVNKRLQLASGSAQSNQQSPSQQPLTQQLNQAPQIPSQSPIQMQPIQMQEEEQVPRR